jgi:transcriptional regulator with XRE-family HTH domain
MATNGLTNKQLKALELLTTSVKTQSEIAQEVGVSESYLSRWINNPEYLVFQMEYDRRLEAVRVRARKKLGAMTDRAIEKIGEIAFGQYGSDSVSVGNLRLRACQDILDRGGVPKVTKNVTSEEDVNAAIESELERLRLRGETPVPVEAPGTAG